MNTLYIYYRIITNGQQWKYNTANEECAKFALYNKKWNKKEIMQPLVYEYIKCA